MSVHFSRILPVLFLEYLAVSLARTLFPKMIVNSFGRYSYMAVGIIETLKGLLAFYSSPLFGRLSDKIGVLSGRKYCLLVTVIGTTMPVCIMAFTENMFVYAVFMGISGFFSATFALTFAYISDCVPDKRKRAPAYGLALATFGLSFCIGPIAGSYMAATFTPRAVFLISLICVVGNVFYIITYLPETAKSANANEPTYEKFGVALTYLPDSWNFSETFRVFRTDKFMYDLAVIVFVYYTAVWSLISTLMVYITRYMDFSTVSLGWLMSGYGLATMFSEGILVRVIVPRIGELNSIRVGLVAFALQCIIIAISSSPKWIFISILFSMLANLVYPSVSSLVSKVVSEDTQGEALGALNGIKALTEGFGPLLFGFLMSLFESTPQPGAPYLITAVIAMWAFLHSFQLKDEPDMPHLKAEALRRGLNEGESLLDGRDTDDYEDDSREEQLQL